jgi:neurotransmitter:Na+ symporter, NSS family
MSHSSNGDGFWSRDIFFVFACIGAAAGLGSLWRFPYVAFENGGAKFLLVYVAFMIGLAVPLTLLEIGLGRWGGGSIAAATARAGKAWTWVGWWALINSMIIVLYYCAIIGWCVQYFFYAFVEAWQPDPKIFLFGTVLQLSDSAGDVGGFSLFGTVCLALVWVSIFLVVRSGTSGLSRVLLFTVPLPVVMLVVLTWRSLELPGGWDGLQALFDPGAGGLTSPPFNQVANAAASQVILAMSLGMGQLVAYSSRRRDDGKLVYFGILICAGVFLFSLLAGMTVFSTAGYLSHIQNVPLKDLGINSLPLAFITYPAALSTLPWAPLWGAIFFLLLILISVDSAFAVIEANVAGLFDMKLESVRGAGAGWLCLIGFLGGLPFLTGAGLYWLDIVDHWVAQYSIVAILLLECLLFGLIARHHLSDILGPNCPGWVLVAAKLHFGLVIPLFLVMSFGGSFLAEMNGNYMNYPSEAILLGGWGVALSGIFAAILVARIHNRRISHVQTR